MCRAAVLNASRVYLNPDLWVYHPDLSYGSILDLSSGSIALIHTRMQGVCRKPPYTRVYTAYTRMSYV